MVIIRIGPVAVASSECFWMLLKVLKIHDYIILYIVFPMVSPVAWYKPLWAPHWMTSQLSTSPTTSHWLRFSTDPVEESRQLRDQAKVVGPHDLADHRTKNHQKPEVVLDGALKTQHLVDIDHWPPHLIYWNLLPFLWRAPIVDLIGFWPLPESHSSVPWCPHMLVKILPMVMRSTWQCVVVFDHPGGWQNAVQNSRQRRLKPIRCQKNVAGWEIH